MVKRDTAKSKVLLGIPTDTQDISVFESVIEIVGPRFTLKFELNDNYWKVFMLNCNTWIFEINLIKIDNESNNDMFDRAYDEIFQCDESLDNPNYWNNWDLTE
jgi:hypothetical protein